MVSALLQSPAFVGSALVTLAVLGYTYIYLPRQMRRAYRQGLVTLARAVETKDVGSVGHGERVAEYTVAVAEEMKLPKTERTKIEYATFLQDVGNARVPHSILNKSEDLTDEEFEVVKTHVMIGAEVIEQVKFLQEISPLIRHHHEAWDGSGYPEGISGDNIPLGARIIAVCTSYDSMLHDRPYRAAIDEQEAVKEIRAGAGAKYDPAVVDAFLRILKRKHGRRAQV